MKLDLRFPGFHSMLLFLHGELSGDFTISHVLNYLTKFLLHIADKMAPICNLTKANVQWTWSQIHEDAFGKIKKLVSEAPVLRYYDHSKPFVIQCDASEKGFGTALLQESKPLVYVSRALTDKETRYLQIEKELLTVVYACKRFQQYIFSLYITVLSDHKPLEAMMKKELGKCPKYLQNMLQDRNMFCRCFGHFPIIPVRRRTSQIHYQTHLSTVQGGNMRRMKENPTSR